MDPYIATIVRKSALIAGGIALAGLVVAIAYGLSQYARLQYAMQLNLIPPQLP